MEFEDDEFAKAGEMELMFAKGSWLGSLSFLCWQHLMHRPYWSGGVVFRPLNRIEWKILEMPDETQAQLCLISCSQMLHPLACYSSGYGPSLLSSTQAGQRQQNLSRLWEGSAG